jgi:hypothetical protein
MADPETSSNWMQCVALAFDAGRPGPTFWQSEVAMNAAGLMFVVRVLN